MCECHMVGAKRAVHPGTRHLFRVEWELEGLCIRGESVLGGSGRDGTEGSGDAT